ncbi:DNA replication licensing factor mcm6, partial [Globisporangium splendens]
MPFTPPCFKDYVQANDVQILDSYRGGEGESSTHSIEGKGVRGLKACGVREAMYNTCYLACLVRTMEQRLNCISIRSEYGDEGGGEGADTAQDFSEEYRWRTQDHALLKYIYSFLLHAIYVSGKVSSAVGLTASTTRDTDSGDFDVEADTKDQVAVHKSMEQHKLSTTNTGIQAMLNARTSILAAANSYNGRYDKTKTLTYNVSISAPIFSRFNQFFVILGNHDETTNQKLVEHTVNIHMLAALQESITGAYQEEDLNRYIKLVCIPVAHLLWRHTAAVTTHGIWGARLRRLDGRSQSDRADSAILIVALHNGLHSLRRSRTHPLVTRPTETSTAKEFFILFFDGGSRGNPGSGGSGAVIVRVQTDNHTAEILWVASMAYRHPSTTNNTAEYRGLVHGLRHAQAARLHPLHVVGDSATVISQQRCHRPPKDTRLLQLYHKARRIADVIGVKSWAHHYREFNKMADRAANVAMDTQISQQVAAAYHREVLITVTQFLDNDVLHWLSARPGGCEQQWRFPTTEAEQAQQLQHHIHLVVRTASAAPSAL